MTKENSSNQPEHKGFPFTFHKSERLTGRKNIEALVHQSSVLRTYLFHVRYRVDVYEQNYPVRVVIHASKRFLPKGADRIRMKRLMREAYRHLKAEVLYPFLSEKNLYMHLFISFTNRELKSQQEVFDDMGRMMAKLKKEIG